MKFARLLLTMMIAAALTLSAQSKAGPAPGKARDSSREAPKDAGAAKAKAAKEPVKEKAATAADQCTGMTQDGDRCKRKSAAGSKFCWQHGSKKKSS